VDNGRRYIQQGECESMRVIFGAGNGNLSRKCRIFPEPVVRSAPFLPNQLGFYAESVVRSFARFMERGILGRCLHICIPLSWTAETQRICQVQRVTSDNRLGFGVRRVRIHRDFHGIAGRVSVCDVCTNYGLEWLFVVGVYPKACPGGFVQ